MQVMATSKKLPSVVVLISKLKIRIIFILSENIRINISILNDSLHLSDDEMSTEYHRRNYLSSLRNKFEIQSFRLSASIFQLNIVGILQITTY